jgi:hypothetical protein
MIQKSACSIEVINEDIEHEFCCMNWWIACWNVGVQKVATFVMTVQVLVNHWRLVTKASDCESDCIGWIWFLVGGVLHVHVDGIHCSVEYALFRFVIVLCFSTLCVCEVGWFVVGCGRFCLFIGETRICCIWIQLRIEYWTPPLSLC